MSGGELNVDLSVDLLQIQLEELNMLSVNNKVVPQTSRRNIAAGQFSRQNADKTDTGSRKTCRIKFISPNNAWFRLWEYFCVFTIIAHCILVMYMAAFNSSIMPLWGLVYLFDFVYLVQFLMTFFTGYVDQFGIEVHEGKLILQRYLKGTFVLDVIATLPTDILVLFITVASPWKLLAQLRMTRLVGFFRVLGVFAKREEELGTNTVVMRGLKYCIICLITTHACTCIWFTCSCSGIHPGTEPSCYTGTWAVEQLTSFDLAKADTWTSYIVSLYWAVATVTSTGYGDISAVNTIERWLSVFCMLLGIAVFFGMLLGGMTSILTNFDTQRSRYVHRFLTIKEHLNDLNVPKDLQERVNGYYEYLWVRKKGHDNEGIYDALPLAFQAEISHTTNSGILEKAPIFSGLGSGFLRMLSLNIKPQLYLPQQIIITRGDVGQQMYFIHRGAVDVLSEEDDETPIATLKSGKLFGEVSLVYSLPRTATIRAATHCDLMVLDKHELNSILAHYPEVAKQLQEEAKNRCEVAQTAIEEEEEAEDSAHYQAFQPRRSSLVERSHVRRRSFATPAMSPSGQSVSMGIHHHRRMTTVTIAEGVEAIETDHEEQEALKEFVIRHQGNCCEKLHMRWKKTKEFLMDTTLNPESTLFHVWHNLVVAITVLIAIIYPYMAAFTAYDLRYGYPDTELGKSLLAITYIFDFILFLDIIVSLRTDVATPYGVQSNFEDIWKYYCQSFGFACDVVAVIPIELFCFVFPAGIDRWHYLAILRLNRLAKFFRVSQYFSLKEEKLETSIVLIRSLKFVLYIAMLSHWVACTFYWMACSGDSCVEDSWILTWGKNYRGIDSFNASQPHPTTEYTVALYWAAATMSSTGYGDISARTTTGRFVSLFAMLIGLLLYGYVLAQMAATLANEDSPKVRFQEKLFGVMNFMKERNLSVELQERVIGYMSLLWEKHKGEWMPGQKSLMHDTPTVLQQDIAYEDASRTLSRVPLFKDTDESFLRSLALQTTSYLFQPGEVIIYEGEIGREMYVIRRGQCQILIDNGKRLLADIGPGQYFGEVGMIFGDYRTATVKAKTHAEVLMLTLDDLNKTLKDFPLLKDQFTAAVARRDHLGRIQEEHQVRVEECAKLAESTLSVPDEGRGDDRRSSLRSRRSSRRSSRGSRRASKGYWHDSTKSFHQRSGSGDKQRNDYEEPFEHLSPFIRILTKLFLMRRTFMPTGNWLKLWTLVQVLVAVAYTFVVFIQLAFYYNSLVLWVLAYTLDLMGFINLYVGLHTAYYNERNILITHPLSTAKNFLKTNFLLDLISCFPFEIFAYVAYPHLTSDGLHIFSLVRVTRLLQVYKVPLAFNYLESSIHKETGFIREVKFFFYSLMFMNMLTCLLFILSCPPMRDSQPGTFTQSLHGHKCWQGSWLDRSINVSDSGTSSLYVISLYWASATTVSVGYGEIHAYTDNEMLVAMSFMILGVMFFGYIIASVAASLANADAQRARFQEKLTTIAMFMEDQDIADSLRERVVAYYQYIWLRTRGVEPESLFDGLPYAVWGDVTLDLYEESIAKISLFKGTEVSFIKMLSKCIKPLLFLKGEYVVKKHDIGSEMYFIHRGAVDVCSEDGSIIFDTMRAGAAFGEVALLFSCPRTASIKARVNSDVFVLNKSDLDQVLDLYPKVKEQVMRIAHERQEQARQRSAANKINQAPPPKISVKSVGATDSITSVDSEEDEEEITEVKIDMPSEDNTSQESGAVEQGPVAGSSAATSSATPQLQQPGEATDAPSNEKKTTVQRFQQKLNKRRVSLPDDFGQRRDSVQERSVRRFSLSPQDSLKSDPSVVAASITDVTSQIWDEPGTNVNQNNPKADDKPEEVEIERVSIVQRFRNMHRFTINPNDQRLKKFNGVMAFVGFLSAWLILFQAAYQEHHPAILAVNYICDLICIIEIYIRFHSSFYDDFGDLVEDVDSVMNNYLHSPGGFAVDMVAAAPLDILVVCAVGQSVDTQLAVLSYLRLIHLGRLVRVSQFFNKWEKMLNINMLMVRLIKFIGTLVLTMHLFSCIWYMIACPNAHCKADTWATQLTSGMVTSLDAYAYCIYWCVATMTSTGYGDVRAVTQIEMVFASLVMISGKLLFGFILGNIASTLANEESQKVKYEGHMTAIKNNMVDQEVPKPLRKRVTNYFDYLWMRNKGVNSTGIFKDVPTCMLADIYLTLTKEMLDSIPLFQGTEDSFLRQLAPRIKQTLFLPGDYIVCKGDMGQELFYINRGEVEVMSESDASKVDSVIASGNIFGELSLVCSIPRRVTVRALTHVDIYTLSKADLDHVLAYYPVVEAQITQSAQERFGHVLTAVRAVNKQAQNFMEKGFNR